MVSWKPRSFISPRARTQPTQTVYSGVTVTLLAYHNHLSGILAMSYSTICALALASHAKTTFTDPGAIPQAAVPRTSCDGQHPANRAMHAMCSHCQTYKPPMAHHCRICNRCISRMDHHCPWMNNCVGIGNLSTCVMSTCSCSGHCSCCLFTLPCRTLYSLSCLYLDWICFGPAHFRLELFSLRLVPWYGIMYLFDRADPTRSRHDLYRPRSLPLYIVHADKCHAWCHDWCGDN